MTSVETLELLEKNAEKHEQRGKALTDSDHRQAAEHFQKAAAIHDKLAAECQSRSERKLHSKRSAALHSAVERLTGNHTPSNSAENTRIFPNADSDDQNKEDDTDATLTNTAFLDPTPDKDLSDYGGMDDLVDRLREEIQYPLEHPEFYEKQGVGIENGVLLYGPPGTGKSHLTECFAGELGWHYAEVHAADISSKWVGEASSNVKALFEEARQYQPCLVFLDELDAIASDRSAGPKKTNSERQAVNELLQQLQSVQGEDVVVVAATNKPGDLDTAVTRSGRFNQEFYIGAPDADARKHILEVQLDDDDREVDWESLNWRKLVQWSQGFSAADLENVVSQAVRESARESTERGELVPVQYRHLLEKMKDVEPSLDETNSRS